MTRIAIRPVILLALVIFFPAINRHAVAGGRGRGGGVPTLGIANGLLERDTPDFNLKLVRDSQTIAALEPKEAKGFNSNPFDFTPAYQLSARAGDGFNHLGDLTFRIRTAGETPGQWTAFTTSAARKPVTPAPDAKPPQGAQLLAAANLAPTLPADCPLDITRSWLLDPSHRLVLHFDITNKSEGPIEIGALGIPVIFNNIIPGNNRAQGYSLCSFFDPYVGQQGGYLQVTRLNGSGPALVVVPENPNTPFEAYRKINDGTATSQTFEGAFEWMAHSKAYADNEWRNAKQWNPATSETLAPHASTSFGLRFLVSPEIRDIEKTLAANNRPVAVGIPGYILPMDLDGKLLLNTAGRKITGIETDPPNAIEASLANTGLDSGWTSYTLHGKTWGRVRLTISYDDQTKQAVHYYITKPAADAVSDLGSFLFNQQWFDVPNDPFKRSPSIMTYDRAKNQIVTQDTRVWIAGLGDEGGSSWLTGAMKEFGQPKKEEVDKFAQFVDKVLWGGLQVNEGAQMYGVRKSLFYYDPQAFPNYYIEGNWRSWTSWNYQQGPGSVNRAYDYPHVVAAYWAMYRLARNNPGLVTNQKWDWYLDHAYQTTRFLFGGGGGRGGGVGYVNTGLMEGDIFVYLLQDLKREGWNDQASTIEAAVKRRADTWNRDPLPFGSEMAWDSTGQEEVYAWTTYFGYADKAQVSLNSILGYMPTVPHWGYNGNARRYWDFQYGGAPGGGIERQLHHYGSGINSLPALAQYRQHPDDFYLLRIGIGGDMGALSNIDQEGFASAAFHSYPQNLRWDAYSGDYAQNFFGHAAGTGTYLINHPTFGWQAFNGNVAAKGDPTSGYQVSVKVLDSLRRRIYVAPAGLYLTLDAGAFDSIDYNSKTHAVRITFAPAEKYTPEARLIIEQPAKIAGVGKFSPAESLKSERDAIVVPLQVQTTTIELVQK